MKTSDNIGKIVSGFFASLFKELARATGVLIIAFVIGSGAAAGVCMYYGIPLVFSLIGGFLVLGIAIAIMLDSPFS